MTKRTEKHIPSGWPSVIPRLFVEDPEQLVDFLKDVFGASGTYNEDRPSEIWIGESLVMVGVIVERMPTNSFIYVYVEDTDAAYSRALAWGAKSFEEPQEMPYGDRRAMVKDRWGNRWQIATHRSFDSDG